MILKQPLIIPPLEGGDRLSRDEFGRRYQAARHIKKAELIEGVVYVASPFLQEVTVNHMGYSLPG